MWQGEKGKEKARSNTGAALAELLTEDFEPGRWPRSLSRPSRAVRGAEGSTPRATRRHWWEPMLPLSPTHTTPHWSGLSPDSIDPSTVAHRPSRIG